MKWMPGKLIISDQEERDLAAAVRNLSGQLGEDHPAPPTGVYWTNLIVRMNRRIDDATSGKALSISWAARVAIPGVVAIISFFIGLHYYAPLQPKEKTSLTAMIAALPEHAVDSLLEEQRRLGRQVSAADFDMDPLVFSSEQIADYMIRAGNLSAVVESMTDGQVEDVLATLSTTGGQKQTH